VEENLCPDASPLRLAQHDTCEAITSYKNQIG